jgi:hypothetical protein
MGVVKRISGGNLLRMTLSQAFTRMVSNEHWGSINSSLVRRLQFPPQSIG